MMFQLIILLAERIAQKFTVNSWGDIDYAGRLKKIRLKMDLKQTEVAAAAGLSLRTYQRYEYGQRQPTADVLVALANFYDVSIDYLVGRTNNPNMNR